MFWVHILLWGKASQYFLLSVVSIRLANKSSHYAVSLSSSSWLVCSFLAQPGCFCSDVVLSYQECYYSSNIEKQYIKATFFGCGCDHVFSCCMHKHKLRESLVNIQPTFNRTDVCWEAKIACPGRAPSETYPHLKCLSGMNKVSKRSCLSIHIIL
jgi:hypothetical protein